MGQLPAQITNAAKQVGQAVPAIGTQANRFVFHPDNVQGQSAENRFIPMSGDWPIQDYGYKTPIPPVPNKWYRDAQPTERNVTKTAGL